MRKWQILIEGLVTPIDCTFVPICLTFRLYYDLQYVGCKLVCWVNLENYSSKFLIKSMTVQYSTVR